MCDSVRTVQKVARFFFLGEHVRYKKGQDTSVQFSCRCIEFWSNRLSMDGAYIYLYKQAECWQRVIHLFGGRGRGGKLVRFLLLHRP